MVHAHSSHAELRRHGERSHARKVAEHKSAGGHAGTPATKAQVIKAVHEHERADHPGKPETPIKLKRAGRVEGKKAKRRLDRAAGGRTKGKHKGTTVNIVVAGGRQDRPMPVPVAGMGRPPMGPGAAPPPAPPPGAPGMPPRPPMGPPVAAGVPGMRKHGGRTKHERAAGGRMNGGAGGALGRIEKAEHVDGETFHENEAESENVEGKPAGKGDVPLYGGRKKGRK